jgi:hypothetical protein
MYRIALLLFLVSPLVSVAAQECAVSVPATIVDEASGKFVPGIGPEMIRAKIGQAVVPVRETVSIKSQRIIVLFDQSGSMDAVGPTLGHMRAAMQRIQATFLTKIFSQLQPETQVLIGAFHQESEFGSDFSRDPEELHKMLDEVSARLKKHGKDTTSIFDALQQALSRFGAARSGDAVVLLTDGGDNSSKVKAKTLVQELAGGPVRIFTVLFTGSPVQVQAELESMNWPREFADLTGGNVYRINVADPIWISDQWSEQARANLAHFWTEQVLSGYTLHFQMPLGTKKNQKLLLAVNPSANSGKRVSAFFPAQLAPCAVTTSAR